MPEKCSANVRYFFFSTEEERIPPTNFLSKKRSGMSRLALLGTLGVLAGVAGTVAGQVMESISAVNQIVPPEYDLPINSRNPDPYGDPYTDIYGNRIDVTQPLGSIQVGESMVIDHKAYTVRWIGSWEQTHVASSNLECDFCREPIYKGCEYVRKVGVLDTRGREYIIIERTHDYPSCK